MKIFPRWLALAAALPLSASAQSGAAFGVIPAGLAVPAQLKTAAQQPQSGPEPVGEPVERELWRKVISRCRDNGTLRPSAGDDAAYGIDEEFNEPDGTYRKMSLDVHGDMLDDEFFPQMAVFTSIRRTTTAAGLRVEGDVFVTDMKGRLLDAQHHTVLRSPDGKLTTLPVVTLDRAHPAVAAVYAGIVKYWAK